MKEKKELISEDVLTQRVTQFSSVCDPSAHLDRGEGPPVSSGAGWLPGHHLRTCGTLDSMEKGLSPGLPPAVYNPTQETHQLLRLQGSRSCQPFLDPLT